MNLEQSIPQKKASILSRWLDLIMDSYPPDTSGFLRREKDRFANPVGYIISHEIVALFDELLRDMDAARLSISLDSIIRIRSVQDYPPSEAIAFIFLLKKALREELRDEISHHQGLVALRELEDRIDRMALLALDIYTSCREKIHQIRLNEVKTERERAFRMLDMTNRIFETPDAEENPAP